LNQGEDNSLLGAAAKSEPLESLVADKELREQAMNALDRLPEPYRVILEMFFLQDLSYEKIAKRLRIPEGTVMSRLHKARKLLQNSWDRREALAKLDE
jgi:RNA polymerase sigma-70 factor (ECF subfamily)